MELKDAEYQEWFDEPQTDYWTKEPLDNTKYCANTGAVKILLM